MTKLWEFFLLEPAGGGGGGGGGAAERAEDPLPGSGEEVQAVAQEESRRSSGETADAGCGNSGLVADAAVPSEDPSEGHSSESSSSQCAGSDGDDKEVPEMYSKSGGNDENSECTDQSSPRAVLDISVSGSVDSDESSSVEQPAVPSRSVQPLQWRNLISGLILSRKKLMARAVTFPQRSKSTGLKRYLGRMRSGKNQMDCSAIAPEIFPEIEKWRPSWRSFDYDELCAATDRFSSDNLIGKGGHAEVYKGQLADGQFVAVKRLTKGGNKEDRISDFLSELGIIAHVNHLNAAQLLGFSVEGGLHLVLQFSPHGSLASLLHGAKGGLRWKARFNIALGIAEGLFYLHEGCHRHIIHRDIKASNILLTEDYQPQISDFGLAKWLPDKCTHQVVFPIEGTFGYMAPEYFMHGIINEKTDVFAYGVLLLELVTGRKAVDSSRQSLVIWAKPLLESNNMKGLVDPSLDVGYDPEEMALTLAVASMCIHHSANLRPSMKSVVRFMKGDRESLELMGKPKPTKPPMFDSCDSEDYTRTSYLNDLDKHKQLALEQ
ncbi:receptor-like cytosolic serine/threonine-protein kinase RBK1 isoform X1 [Triticum dicoccoides]|uniref:receptor-like cytosolic serine/threonine-protein kinase RBK1 isoform X1 n=1 Tax=Triticum dicoccoides TaxID=85692 RepID=UPI000E793837|nr:receptor-like cytosolic serine/threonine-protein kinase RBK1 isoform X1 [Triticum dicoccoides]